MTDEPNDVDTLMDADPLSLSKQDIDKIIAYHRVQRQRRASGEKPNKEAGPKVDLSKIMGSLLPPKAEIKRRF